jgi:lipopolysaccharide transport system ATP-binding protein
MYVRLAFAVAAHLEPEILIVDEVLAVGDAQFQKKCLGKMEDVGKEGRTVIFVSHQMSAIQALCGRGIVLQAGEVILDGSTNDAIDLYLESGSALSNEIPLSQRKDRSGSGKVKVNDVKILDQRGVKVSSLQSGEDYCFEIDFLNETKSTLSNVVISFDVFDERDNPILLFRTNFTNEAISMNPGMNSIKCKIRDLPITLGSYRISIFVSHADQETLDFVKDASSFSVEGGDFFGTGSPGLPGHCKVLTKVDWLYGEAVLDREKLQVV